MFGLESNITSMGEEKKTTDLPVAATSPFRQKGQLLYLKWHCINNTTISKEAHPCFITIAIP